MTENRIHTRHYGTINWPSQGYNPACRHQNIWNTYESARGHPQAAVGGAFEIHAYSRHYHNLQGTEIPSHGGEIIILTNSIRCLPCDCTETQYCIACNISRNHENGQGHEFCNGRLWFPHHQPQYVTICLQDNRCGRTTLEKNKTLVKWPERGHTPLHHGNNIHDILLMVTLAHGTIYSGECIGRPWSLKICVRSRKWFSGISYPLSTTTLSWIISAFVFAIER